MTNNVLCSIQGNIGKIKLNRPDALHTLNLEMCETIKAALELWRFDGNVDAITIAHESGRGFCAGGDVVSLYNSVLSDGQYAKDFFYCEYQLNHLMFIYEKPIIAIMDGITMGGGVGISLPCRYRIATEHTRLAMPETGIGLFPDVGGGWYLPRLPGHIGTYMALTGDAIRGHDCVAAGLATHYMTSANIKAFLPSLAHSPNDVEEQLSQFTEQAPSPFLAQRQDQIATIFAGYELIDILTKLQQDDSEWAKNTANKIASKSPIATCASLRALSLGAQETSFSTELTREYILVCHLTAHPDFAEGVRALLVDKDQQPKWQHTQADTVPVTEIDQLFSKDRQTKNWQPSAN